MWKLLILRFIVGGAIVSLFSILGEMWKPKTFAGLFGSAPSVAIASLAIAFATKGESYVAREAQSMLIGTFALAIYCTACVAVIRIRKLPAALEAISAWSSWFLASFGVYVFLRWLRWS